MSGRERISHRRCACELGHYLAYHGKDQFGAIHMAVTEGRARDYEKWGSTSCGDLLHTINYAMGCRMMAPFVNREEHDGWESGENLYVFIPPFHKKLRRLHSPKITDLKLGDQIVYDYDDPRKTHGAIFGGITHGGKALTFDFGQPGGKVYECEIVEKWGTTYLRGRPLDFAIDLDSYELTEPAETVLEWCTRNELPFKPDMPLQYMVKQWRTL